MASSDAIFQKHNVPAILPLTLCKSERQIMITQLESIIKSLDGNEHNRYIKCIVSKLIRIIDQFKNKQIIYN